jgi:hypothetical protein
LLRGERGRRRGFQIIPDTILLMGYSNLTHFFHVAVNPAHEEKPGLFFGVAEEDLPIGVYFP